MFCRAFSTQLLRCLLYGGCTPACSLFRLSAFIFPRLTSFIHLRSVPTTISLPFVRERPTLQQGTADATARNSRRHSKERPTPQQGTADATARNGRRHVRDLESRGLAAIAARRANAHFWCWGRRRSLTVLTGLKVESGTSTMMVFQSLIAPFQRPGSSKAFNSLPSLLL